MFIYYLHFTKALVKVKVTSSFTKTITSIVSDVCFILALHPLLILYFYRQNLKSHLCYYCYQFKIFYYHCFHSKDFAYDNIFIFLFLLIFYVNLLIWCFQSFIDLKHLSWLMILYFVMFTSFLTFTSYLIWLQLNSKNLHDH